jgi:succinate dehydrogenase/fumarate reductase flavoprotein subunit
MNQIERDVDVLIIGCGLAGLWSGMRAKDFCRNVLIVEKGKSGRSGISTFVHATQAEVPESELMDWLEESVEHMEYLTNQKLAEIILRENGDRIRDMISWGVPFTKDKDGKLKRESTRGQRKAKSLYYEGFKMMEVMIRRAKEKGISFIDRTIITDLLTSDGFHPTNGRIIGAVGFNTITGDFIKIRAKETIISSGLISPKLHCCYADNVTGDGQAMAFRAGAELANMEFSLSPNFSIFNRMFNTGGQTQFQMMGAKLVNSLGEEIMEKYAPFKGEKLLRSTLPLICQAIAKESLEGRGPICFDMRGWNEDNINKIREILPITMRAFDSAGIDLRRDLVEVTPMVTTWSAAAEGGIRIVDSNWSSTIDGLYATGVAGSFISGILLQGLCNVSGYRAGELAGKKAKESDYIKIEKSQIEKLKESIYKPLKIDRGITPSELYSRINSLIVPAESSIFKEEKRLNGTLNGLRNIKYNDLPHVKANDVHELVKANEVRNFSQLAELVYISSLERKESRYSHYREDYPYRDDIDWLKWIYINNDGKEIKVKNEDIPIDRYPIRPKERSKIPAPILFKSRR